MNNAILPSSLDRDSWLEYFLNSDDQDAKYLALKEISNYENIGKFTYSLGKIRSSGDYEKLRDLADFCLQTLESRSEEDSSLEPGKVLGRLSKSGEMAELAFVKNLKEAPSKRILDNWRDNLFNEKNTVLIKIGLILLGQFGEKSVIPQIEKFLSHEDSEVVREALTLIVNLDPDNAKKYLQKSILSKNDKVRVYAVRLLKKLEPAGALIYLRSLINNDDIRIRHIALNEILDYDFKKLEKLLLNYLKFETNPLLVFHAGKLVAEEPTENIQLKLFEILNQAEGEKKRIMNLVFYRNLERLREAGILKQSVKEFLTNLQLQYKLQQSDAIIRLACNDLSSPNTSVRLSAIQRLSPFVEHVSIKRILLKVHEKESKPEIISTIEKLLGANAFSKKKTTLRRKKITVNNANDFFNLAVADQREFVIGVLNISDYYKAKGVLLDVIRKKLEPSVLISILRKFAEFGSNKDKEILNPYLNDSDPSVVAVALRCLEGLDIDFVMPYVKKYLMHNDSRVKTAALEVFISVNETGAIKLLASMIKSRQVHTRRLAVSLLSKVTFSLVEKLLWNLLKYEANVEFKTQAALIVAANPNKDSVNKLFRFCHHKNHTLRKDYAEVWQATLEFAEKAFGREAQQIEEECFMLADPVSDKPFYASGSLALKKGPQVTIQSEEITTHQADNSFLNRFLSKLGK